VVTTGAMAVRVIEEDEYKPFFQLMDDTRVITGAAPSASFKSKLKLAMKAEGLVGEYLEHRNALLPGASAAPTLMPMPCQLNDP
jgi:hypothetical protein